MTNEIDQTPLQGSPKYEASARTQELNVLLRKFLSSTKPDWARPIDVCITAVIIALTNEEGIARPSRATLAAWSGLGDTQAVDDSIRRLLAHGWIQKLSGKKAFNSNQYAICHDAIPKGDLKLKTISNEAKALTHWYKAEVDLLPKKLSRNNRLYRPPVGLWLTRWPHVMQSWLDAGHSTEQIKQTCTYALTTYRDLARRGPQTLKRSFDRLCKEAAPKPEGATDA
ncbi:MAG: hypothetical protein WCC22_20805 [Terriglobales bacterium]